VEGRGNGGRWREESGGSVVARVVEEGRDATDCAPRREGGRGGS
jgi:hypothetical protein